MKNKILGLFLLLVVFAGCDDTLHEIPAEKSVGEAVVTVSLNTEEAQQAPLNDVHLYWFNENDKLYKHDYYPTMEELALARVIIPEGSYTVFAVLNVGESFSVSQLRSTLPDIDLGTFTKSVKAQESMYALMLTGTMRKMVKNGVQLVYVDLKPKSEGIKDASVELRLAIPSYNFPEVVTTRSASSLGLRGTAFVFKKGSNELFAVKRAMLTPVDAENGVYSMGLSLFDGEYDVNLWCDYAIDEMTDLHYNTTGPDVITIQPKESYIGNTDARDCFSQRISLMLTEENNAPVSVDMHRPLAKYRLLATDVADYEAKRIRKGLPELKDLQVEIDYEGFFPSAYNMKESILADAGIGYGYRSTLSDMTASAAIVAKDYVLVNGSQSSVTVTILIKDTDGNIISGVRGIKIAYRSGQLTTVSGDFLTASLTSGVTIDTEWSGNFDVYF